MGFFFFQAEDGIRDLVRSRGLGDVYKRQGAKTFGGYGVIHDSGRKGKIVRAHRLSWELRNGPFPVSYTHLTLPTSDLV